MQISQTAARSSGGERSQDVRVGDRVRVRRQRWVVTAVRPHDQCSVITLSGLGPGNAGLERQVLAPFDLVESLASPRSLRIVRPRRWRRVCRQLIADGGPSSILRTARSARMDLMPYQLEPALAIIHGRGTRVLIADEVGLGKTVQAALIVSELKSRGAISRVLVLAPAGLREQWIEECSSRFKLRMAFFDMAAITRRRASLPAGVNPWAVEPFVVTSIDYVKRAEVRAAVEACRWDVLIVDEAHHAAIGTDRHDVVSALAGAAAYVVLLTATPHNGDADAFASLCALGEQSDSLLTFRRTRQQVGLPHQRRVHQVRVRPGGAERAMHAAVDAFVRAVQREPNGRDHATWLALSTLRKRALSSAFALQRTVERRLLSLNDGFDDAAQQLPLPLLDVGGEFDPSDDVPAWAIPALRDANHERALLSRIARAASSAIGRETKLAVLQRLLRRIREPAIVFSEYRDTLAHVFEHVSAGAAVLHGGLSRDERRRAIERFQHGSILLATDAAGEGLNLHRGCRIVVNLELPWNPMRLEQRIGRVDRIGQQRRVHVFHLIAAGTAEMRVLQRLGSRIARAQFDIGASNPLVAVPSSERREAATLRMEAEANSEHQRLAFARQMISAPSSPDLPERTIDRHALVTFTKRRSIRGRLGNRVLMLSRSTLADGLGQPIAYHLTAFTTRRNQDFVWSLPALDSVNSVIAGDEDYQRWLRTSLTTHHSFWTTRLARERNIAGARHLQSIRELQPGLFDRRAERVWFDREEQRREGIQDQTYHVDHAARLAHVDPPYSQIALVLFTR